METMSSHLPKLDEAMGKMTLEQINLVFKHLPVDITYVDENEIVKLLIEFSLVVRML